MFGSSRLRALVASSGAVVAAAAGAQMDGGAATAFQDSFEDGWEQNWTHETNKPQHAKIDAFLYLCTLCFPRPSGFVVVRFASISGV